MLPNNVSHVAEAASVSQSSAEGDAARLRFRPWVYLQSRLCLLFGVLFQTSLATKLLSIVLFPLLPLIMFVVGASVFDRHEQLVFATSRVSLLAKAAAVRASSSMQAAAQLSRTLRSTGVFESDASQCTGVLRRLDLSGPLGIAGVTLFDGDGNVRCTSKPAGSEADVADRSWFELAHTINPEQFVVSGLTTSRVFDKDIISVASPLHPDDPMSAIIAVALHTSWFAELTQEVAAREGGSVLIIDRRDGVVLGASDGLREIAGRRFPNHPLTDKVLSPSPSWSGIVQDYAGIRSVFGLAAVDGPDGEYATIAVGVPQAVTLTAVRFRLAAGLTAATALTLLAAWFAWQRANRLLLQPFRHLTERVRSVHLGDLSARPSTAASTFREMGLLFESFDAMSSALQSRDDALAASRAELATSEEHHRILADSATDMITRFDAHLVRMYVSPACRDVLGYEPEELLGRQPQSIIHPDDLARVNATLNNALLTGHGETRAVYRAFRKDGREIWVETSGRRLPDGAGAVVVTRDVSERKRFEASLELANRQLDRLARLDALTELNNRRAFDEQLRSCMADGTGFALILLDVDWFKAYNDTYGHQAGDECLKAVADCTRLTLRDTGDFLARYGGEEFAIILPGADEAAACLVAERILAAMAATSLPHCASPVGHVTVSIGVASCGSGSNCDRAEETLSRADAALYQAKRAGRNMYQVTAVR